MQENTAVRLGLSLGDDASEWLILGSYQDCIERIAWCRDEARLTRLTVNYIPLADSVTEVLEYLEGFGENVIDVIG